MNLLLILKITSEIVKLIPIVNLFFKQDEENKKLHKINNIIFVYFVIILFIGHQTINKLLPFKKEYQFITVKEQALTNKIQREMYSFTTLEDLDCYCGWIRIEQCTDNKYFEYRFSWKDLIFYEYNKKPLCQLWSNSFYTEDIHYIPSKDLATIDFLKHLPNLKIKTIDRNYCLSNKLYSINNIYNNIMTNSLNTTKMFAFKDKKRYIYIITMTYNGKNISQRDEDFINNWLLYLMTLFKEYYGK